MRCILLFAVFWLVLGLSNAESSEQVRFVVHVPADTPVGESIYVAGSSVGNWKPDGLKLSRQSDETYTGNLELEASQLLEFKITRGSWDTVEKSRDGSDRANRVAKIEETTKQVDVTVERWASEKGTDKRQNTVVGNLKLHKIDSRALNQSRTIRVWLPPGYTADSSARYDVLYMHDGQNCFDRATSAFGNEWEIDETLTRLIAEKKIPPLIVVGIDNGLGERINEYTYTADTKRGGGQGAAYATFLLTEVKPFVEQNYRTLPGPTHTFIGGSSLGGLVSLEIARRNKGVFGGVIAMSPSLQWADESLTKEIEHDAGGLEEARVWIDMGTREGSSDVHERFVNSAHRLDAALTKHHVAHHLEIDEQHAEHNEPSWASRFPRAISYIEKQL